jgi:hypothetical protein
MMTSRLAEVKVITDDRRLVHDNQRLFIATVPGILVDSLSLTGWRPACPNELSYSVTAKTAAPGTGASTARPRGLVGIDLCCYAPQGLGRGTEPKACD